MRLLLQLLVAGAFCWFLASSLWVYPHSLSYFNESIGGPLNGPKHLLGSAVDWGQDLRYLKWWQEENAEGERLYIASIGSVNPSYLGIECEGVPPEFPQTNTKPVQPTGYYAISRNFLSGDAGSVFCGASTVHHYGRGALSGWRSRLQITNLGYSLCIFKIDDTIRTTLRYSNN